MKKVITYGTFDLLHKGHVALLRRARQLGDYLIVAVSSDEFNSIKHKEAFYCLEDRIEILLAIKYVDKVIVEDSWTQKVKDIKNENIDIFVMGDDWKGEFDTLSSLCEVVYLPRTPNISTTGTKKQLAQK
ncbi:MAG: glycerol-3-phosphate cytidylyltransferase [Culicoidibacterales bacterium]